MMTGYRSFNRTTYEGVISISNKFRDYYKGRQLRYTEEQSRIDAQTGKKRPWLKLLAMKN